MKKLFRTLIIFCAVFCLGLGLCACDEQEETYQYPYKVTFPDEITVKRDGEILKSGDGIDSFAKLEITLNTAENGDWSFEGFEVSGAHKSYTSGEENIYYPNGDVKITLELSHKYLKIYKDSSNDEYYFSGVKSNFTGDELIIPEKTYTNDPITSIESNALNGSNIKKVVLPETIREIDGSAFENCANLEEINIPNAVESIYSNAFKNCSNLDIEINCSSLGYIGESAFENCSKLKKVTFGDKLQKVGKNAFKGCANLTDFICEAGEVTKNSYVGEEAFCDCVNLTGTILIPSVSEIEKNAFKNCENITKVIMPECVTEIENSVFYNCSSLQEINIPQAIETLPTEIFYNCSSLANINLPNNLTSIGDYAFYNCENLQGLNLPSSLTNIGSYAFYNCENLQGLNLPSSLTNIGSYAFYNCANLEELNLPSSNMDIGSYAFYNCEKLLLDLVINEDVEDYTFYNCKLLKSVTFGEGAENIGEYAFYGCTSLETLNLTNNVSKIDRCAFADCNNLESIEMGNSVRQISYNAFEGCEKLNDFNFIGTITDWLKISFDSQSANPASLLGELKINGEVKDLEVTAQYRFYSYAFYNISNLKKLTIPATVTSIGSCAFHNCSGLEKIEYDSNITRTDKSGYIFDGAGTSGSGIELIIGSTVLSQYIFSSNNNIKSVLLKDSVEKIEDRSMPFIIHSLTIGAGLKEIEEYFAYGSNGNVRDDFDLNYLGTIEDWAKIKFKSEHNNPISCKGKFKMNGTPVTEITIDFDVSDYAFYQFTDLKTLTINKNTHKIGKQAFYKCSNVKTFLYDTEISESDYDTSADYMIFGDVGFNSYMDLTIGPNVRTILTRMFVSTKINKLEINDNLVSINSLAFGWAAIKSIKYGSGISHIANNAFDICDIDDITIKNSYVYQYRYSSSTSTIKTVRVLKSVDDITNNSIYESAAYTRGEITINEETYTVYVYKF